MQICFL